MTTDVNPYRELNANISPRDFEFFCMETLKAYAEQEGLQDYSISHNRIIKTHDGNYQIDVYVEYTVFGTRNIMLVECKKHKNSIKREIVSALHDKLQSINAQKGLIISTAGFQSGATQYASEHNIALWQVCDASIKRICCSASKDFLYMQAKTMLERHLPKYFVMEWDCHKDYPFNEIYPTQQMRKEAIAQVRDNIIF